MFESIRNILAADNQRDKTLKQAVKQMIGKRPGNLQLYRLAFMHSSANKETLHNGFRDSNERLEYLGDSVLGMIVAEYLFKKYPYKDEGFLTDIRSRIVNRESLNGVARRLGIDKLIEFDTNRKTVLSRTSMYGDALEALVGAIYLDKGFKFTQQFILDKLLSNHFDLDTVVQNNTNFKSLVIEWAQKEGKDLRFEIEERGSMHNKEFIAQLNVDNEHLTTGSGYSKKKAEQSAAMKACEILELK
jgi:ribonuclease III